MRIGGRSTGVRLQICRREILERIAGAEGFKSVTLLLDKPGKEIVELRGEMANRSESLLGVGCVKHVSGRGSRGVPSLFRRMAG